MSGNGKKRLTATSSTARQRETRGMEPSFEEHAAVAAMAGH
jgi:hypothetical protein